MEFQHGDMLTKNRMYRYGRSMRPACSAGMFPVDILAVVSQWTGLQEKGLRRRLQQEIHFLTIVLTTLVWIDALLLPYYYYCVVAILTILVTDGLLMFLFIRLDCFYVGLPIGALDCRAILWFRKAPIHKEHCNHTPNEVSPPRPFTALVITSPLSAKQLSEKKPLHKIHH